MIVNNYHNNQFSYLDKTKLYYDNFPVHYKSIYIYDFFLAQHFFFFPFCEDLPALNRLELLDMSVNDITGIVPPSIGALSSLKILYF